MTEIAKYNGMMSYLTRPPAPKTQVADLVDDLEPGPLKDELLEKFDPSQESYEDYLKRMSIPYSERPFNASNGGSPKEEIVEPSKSMQVDTTTRGLPDPLEEFKKQSDLYLQASFASTNKDYFNSLIEQEYNKALEAGVQPQEAISFLKERSQMYRTLAEEGRMQGEPAILGPSYGRENKALGSAPDTEAPLSLEESTMGPGGFPMTAGFTTVLKAPSAIKSLDSTLTSKAINFFKNIEGPARDNIEKARKFLNEFFTKEREKNPDLKKISIDKVSPTGSISYRVNTPDGFLSDKGLQNIVTKRNDYFDAKEKPFRDAGYISTDEAVSFLKEKGFATRKQDPSGKGLTTAKTDLGAGGAKGQDPIVKRLGPLTKEYGIDTKQGPGYGGKQIFVKKSDLEDNIDQILKDYLPKKEKIILAKNLADEFGAESYSQINKLLKDRGYTGIENKDLKKYFKKYRGTSFKDPDFSASATPTNVIQKVRRDKIKLYGAPNVERALISLKKNLGFGQTSELMHPLTKKKATESLYDPEDLMFGSFKENRQYNQGLEGIRNTVQNTLKKIKNDFSPKDLKNNITIEVPNYLRRDYDFPKTMPIKKYVDKLNYMMTDIGLKTDGKVRGALLDENFELVESKLGVDYKNVPGMGLIEDNLKSLDPLFKKLKYDRSKGYESGNLLFDDNGMPLLKKGKKLTNEEAEILVTFISNINKQAFKKFSKSQPVSVDDVKEAFKRIPNREGGRVNLKEGTPKQPIFKKGAASQLSKLALVNPASILGLNYLFGIDPESSLDRTALAAEAALSKEIVRGSQELVRNLPKEKRRAVQRLLNLGLSPKLAIRAARLANPLGILSLLGEGSYQAYKKIKEDPGGTMMQKIDALKEAKDDYYEKGEMFSVGGRVGFADGPEDPSKRKFMKIMGGLASLPIVGKFFKIGEKAAPIIDAVKTEAAKGKPEWFDALVNKVIREGTDMTKQFATKEREIVHAVSVDEDSFVKVVQDLDEGVVRVEYESPENVYGDQVVLEYKKPLPDEGDPRPTAEFNTAESGPVGRVVGPDDVELDVDEVGGTSIEDLDSDVSKLKEYATGKKPTMKEIVQNKKRKDKAAAITDDIDGAASDAVVRRQGDYDPSDYED